jgi:hypothetical protein
VLVKFQSLRRRVQYPSILVIRRVHHGWLKRDHHESLEQAAGTRTSIDIQTAIRRDAYQ